MLTSLFGDLRAARDAKAKSSDFEDTEVVGGSQDFAATAIMESIATEVNDRGQIIDRHVSDLVVTGSPAQAIREHFAATRADLETATSMITLLDPVGVWASSVVKALSDAGGRPIEKLHLREQSTLRTIAMIERTMLVRRQEDTLRIFHADVRAPGPENAEIPVALMERSQMTAVIIGPMQPHAIDALLGSLKHATSLADLALRAPAVPAAAERQLDQRQGRGDRLAGAPSRSHRQRADDRRVVGLERDAQRLERGQAAAGLGSGGGLADARHERLSDQGRRARRRQRRRAEDVRQQRRRRRRDGNGRSPRARRRPRPPGARQPAQARRPARLCARRGGQRARARARDARSGIARHGARRRFLRPGPGCASQARRSPWGSATRSTK